ncbi:MAG TPA: VanZ family protein [Chthoniobacteraceae bacterium]|nr:VanZ family protein [Chthoniobacteraceae bacterium]
MRPSNLLKSWLPVLLWLALMFFDSTDVMSSGHTSRFLIPFLRWLDPEISPAALAQAHLLLRKAAHVTEYAILAALLFRGWRSVFPAFWRRAAATLLPAMLFAASDEFHQSYVASRSSSLGDVLLDWSGALLGLMICAIIWKRHPTSNNLTSQ